MHIGLGAAIENLALAAPAFGLAPTVTLGPRPERPEHVALVTLRPGPVQVSSLFGAIPRRHTNRSPYDTAHPLEPSALTEAAFLADRPDVAVRWLTTPDERRRFAAEPVGATAAFIADKEQADAGHAWFRHDWSELQRRRDGVTCDASGIPPWLGALAKRNLFPSARINDDNRLRSTRESHVATASAFGLLLVRDRHDHRQRLQGGRLSQRMHLGAAGRGIGMQTGGDSSRARGELVDG